MKRTLLALLIGILGLCVLLFTAGWGAMIGVLLCGWASHIGRGA